MTSIGEWWMWPSFFAFVLLMFWVDLFLLKGRRAHHVSTKEALAWTCVWFILALIFNLLIWMHLKHLGFGSFANEKAMEFLAGYLIEKALSVDNLFVILTVFTYFAIPLEYQRRVLIYGVLGAIVMRFVLILLGVWVINQFHWILYFFGVFLLFTGVKIFFLADQQSDLSKNFLVCWISRHFRVTPTLQGERFFVRQGTHLYLTPLFIVLILVEFTDLVFAADSLPAIFAVTNDPFIIITSNVFAILGLRSLYFLLANLNNRFHLLKYGLALILVFVGVKMLIADWFKIPIFIALSAVVLVLVGSIALSMYQTRNVNSKK